MVPLPVVTTALGATRAANFMTWAACTQVDRQRETCKHDLPGAHTHSMSTSRALHSAQQQPRMCTCDLPVPGSPMSSMWHSPLMCVPESSRRAQPPMRVMATASFTRKRP